MGAPERLMSVVTALDNEPIESLPKYASLPVGDEEEDQSQEQSACYNCDQVHLRRRLIYYIDGTVMGTDGVQGSEYGRASNVFRIWASVKEGVVTDSSG